MSSYPKIQRNEHRRRAFDIMTEATARAGEEGIPLEEFLPALADFTAAVGLAVAGEKGIRAFIVRMQSRIQDWRNGTFPTQDFDVHADHERGETSPARDQVPKYERD